MQPTILWLVVSANFFSIYQLKCIITKFVDMSSETLSFLKICRSNLFLI